MDWLLEHLQFVAIVALIIGSMVRKFFEAKAEEREARRRMESSPPAEEYSEPWEPMGEFDLPPPLPQMTMEPTPPPLPSFDERQAAILQRHAEIEEQLRGIRESKAAKKARPARMAKPAKMTTAASPPKPGSIRSVLRDRKSTRRAIVLREILGSPVGLR
jgi:hypothetical protein